MRVPSGLATVAASLPANPFRPGRSLRPHLSFGRECERRRMTDELQNRSGEPVRMTVIGHKGSGKSVLMRQVQEDAHEAGWLTVNLCVEAGSRLRDVVRSLSRVVSAAPAVTNRPVSPPMSEDSLPKCLGSLTDYARKRRHRGVLLAIDDAHLLFKHEQRLNSPLRHVLEAIVQAQVTGHEIALIAAGLPSLTVGLRSVVPRIVRSIHTEFLPPLDDRIMASILDRSLGLRTASVDQSQLSRVVAACHGSPYLLQAWGSGVWDFLTDHRRDCLRGDDIDHIALGTLRWLDDVFYGPSLSALSATSQQCLRAASECPYPPLKSRDLKAVWHRSAGDVDVALVRLSYEDGVFHKRYGEYEYTIPGFHDFLQRTESGWCANPVRQ
ncbi:MAG: ATP-binding protein [Candidatus Dormiibacterota bacterium]